MNVRKRFLLAIAVPLFLWALITAVLVVSYVSGDDEAEPTLAWDDWHDEQRTAEANMYITLTAIAVKGQQTQTATAATTAAQ